MSFKLIQNFFQHNAGPTLLRKLLQLLRCVSTQRQTAGAAVFGVRETCISVAFRINIAK